MNAFYVNYGVFEEQKLKSDEPSSFLCLLIGGKGENPENDGRSKTNR
jgi:hypothetical protein